MSKRQILIAVLVIAALLVVAACILALQAAQSTTQEEPAASVISATPVPTATPERTQEPSPTPSPTEEPTPELTAVPEVPTPVPEPAAPQPLEAVAMGYGMSVDLNGDGVPEEVRFDPTDISDAGNIQIAINDTVFDTAIPAGSGGAGLYMGDILTTDPYTEMFLQVINDTSSSLYVYRYDTGALTRAMTTYTLPAFLASSGTDEQLVDADSIVFYGVHPILVMGDGSFGLLYGDTFTMFQLDGQMHFTETGIQPANVIAEGTAVPAEVPAEVPPESIIEEMPGSGIEPGPSEPEEEPILVLPDIIAT